MDGVERITEKKEKKEKTEREGKEKPTDSSGNKTTRRNGETGKITQDTERSLRDQLKPSNPAGAMY